MQRSTFRLNRPFKAVVYLSFGVLLVTGAWWMYGQARLDDAYWVTLPRLLMKIHGAAAMVSLVVLGALAMHIRRGWKADKNRLSGVLLIAVNVFLIVSGYGLYYAGGEALREWLSRWHAWIGLVSGVLLPAHVLAGRLIIRTLHRRRHPELPSRPLGRG